MTLWHSGEWKDDRIIIDPIAVKKSLSYWTTTLLKGYYSAQQCTVRFGRTLWTFRWEKKKKQVIYYASFCCLAQQSSKGDDRRHAGTVEKEERGHTLQTDSIGVVGQVVGCLSLDVQKETAKPPGNIQSSLSVVLTCVVKSIIYSPIKKMLKQVSSLYWLNPSVRPCWFSVFYPYDRKI